MPIIFSVEDILTGLKTAALAPAVINDRFRASPEDGWHSIDDLLVGEYVYEVLHFGRHTSTQGTVCELMDMHDVQRIVYATITEIQLVRANALTAEHRKALGPPSQALGYNAIEEMGDRRCWFFRLHVLDASSVE